MKLGTPNACNRCHVDKTDKWSDESITKWYGPGRRPHYATVIDAGRKGLPEARKELIGLVGDPLYPVIVRATALSLLEAYPADDTPQAFKTALVDDEALIRRTAIDSLTLEDEKALARVIGPFLYDPVKAVRMEAARKLAGSPAKQLSSDEQKVFRAALHEFEKSMEYSADFAFGRYNLANLYASLNRPEEAIQNYEAAIRIDDLFYPAKVNMAMLFNKRGMNDRAEVLLREVVEAFPKVYEASYSLGLLLAEEKQYSEAALFLERAAEGMPGRARVHYNLGLLLQHVNRDVDAEVELLKALKLGPDNMDYLYALADYYIKRRQLKKAEHIARQMVAKHPDSPMGHQLLKSLMRHLHEE
jgi:tetratricopeptide (TPR) repeat protein